MSDQMSLFGGCGSTSALDDAAAADRYIKSVGGVGALRRKDVPSLHDGMARVLRALDDGRWWTPQMLRRETGLEEAPRRLRELRAAGHIIQKRRVSESRQFEYRIVRG